MWHQGSSTNLTDSVPSLPDEGLTVNAEVLKITVQDNRVPVEGSTVNTEVSKITAQENKALVDHNSIKPVSHNSIKPVNHNSIKAAKNLARVFSLEDRLKQEVEFSQDEFSSKILQFLLEVLQVKHCSFNIMLFYDSMH